MQISRVYFDMDGVLADFDRGVRELCHMEPVVQGSGPAEDDRLWTAIGKVPHFYDLLEPAPGAVDLFRAVRAQFGSRCEILTGIPKPYRGIVTAGEDKTHWVRRILSADVAVHIVYREEKPQFCRGPQDILIDDYPRNIREWENCGGTGILHVSSDETLRALRSLSGAQTGNDTDAFAEKTPERMQGGR